MGEGAKRWGKLWCRGAALVQRGGLRSHLPAATEHGGARLERSAVRLRLGVGHRRLSLGGRLVHKGDGETDRLGRRLHLVDQVRVQVRVGARMMVRGGAEGEGWVRGKEE